MSNKPLKASDQKRLKDAMQRKQKEIEELHLLPPYTIIFSEGVKTEPHYIKGLTKQINEKYSEFGREDRVKVIGTGRNTRDLLNFARRTVDTDYSYNQIVYLMYDKDDFPLDDFDNTQYSAEERCSRQEYRVAWSNECIELWFLLHFQPLRANIRRDQYYEILRRYFPYEKTMENIFSILCEHTDTAISRARELYNSYDEATPPSQRAPATRVYELVEFLLGYL